MIKKEIIWREILYQALEKNKLEFTQKDLANQYGFSLSTVFNALKIPRSSGIIETGGRGFRILDKEKFLYLWATLRKLNKDVVYQTRVEKPVSQIEGEMPPEVIFGAFSAYVKKYKDAPADYDKVYIYASKSQLAEIKKRFSVQKGRENLIVILADPWLKGFGKITPDCQTFVDLWNIGDWFAKDFLKALENQI
ncbi:MAG: helix-turn-helix domain-containing protein [bacterium]|nr:helix-turn-helix domain-containing protein [bacterium]